MPTQRKEDVEDEAMEQLELDTQPVDTNKQKDDGSPRAIGWNPPAGTSTGNFSKRSALSNSPTRFLNEMQVSHKQITDRFVELLNLFETYTRIVREDERKVQSQSESQPPPRLKRTQSEQFTAMHLQLAQTKSREGVRATSSLSHMQNSDSTLREQPRRQSTCEAGSQTNWTPLQGEEEQLIKFQPKTEQVEQQLVAAMESINQSPSQIHHQILVESNNATNVQERIPMQLRLRQHANEAGTRMIGCVTMMGENLTYIMFVMLCMWCLYLIISHYNEFLDNNTGQQRDVKQVLARVQVQPRVAT